MDMVRFAKEYGFGVSGCKTVDDINAWVDIIQHNDIDIDADVSLETIIDVCQKVLDLNNRDVKSIDFSDMLYFPLLFDVDMIQYDWIIVDEAQDTNVCRKLLLKKMLKPGGRLIAIGDPNQAIYGFTGAENNSMELIKTMFDAVELPLSVCYRCGKNIITAAKEYVADIEAFENNNDGEISSIKYDEFVKSTPSLNLNKNDGIICRNNSPLVALAFALIREGIGCRIEGKDIGQNLITLTRKWKVKDLATFTLRLQKHFDRESEKASKAKLALLEDKFDTMMILIERCQTLGKHDVASLQKLISDMFSDNDDFKTPNVVTLSSIHKSKGLEFDNCYILGMSQFQPSKYAVLDWMKEQEKNLSYVAITRAKQKLIHITDCPTRGNREAE
jgi:superfamily I DNA/RNA helicase